MNKIKNKLAFILLTPVFYAIYMPLAFIKSLIYTLLVPFDTQRFANAYVAFFQNAGTIYNGLFAECEPEETQEQQEESSESEPNTVGFRVFQSAAPGLPSYPNTFDVDDD